MFPKNNFFRSSQAYAVSIQYKMIETDTIPTQTKQNENKSDILETTCFDVLNVARLFKEIQNTRKQMRRVCGRTFVTLAHHQAHSAIYIIYCISDSRLYRTKWN